MNDKKRKLFMKYIIRNKSTRDLLLIIQGKLNINFTPHSFRIIINFIFPFLTKRRTDIFLKNRSGTLLINEDKYVHKAKIKKLRQTDEHCEISKS